VLGDPPVTYSIAGRCRRTGRFGVAVCSSSPAVAARCAHVRAGTGAVCSQNVWRRWEPQEGDYVQRALDPDAAPGYGVPGDDRAHPSGSPEGL
jgi:hypothetical protein